MMTASWFLGISVEIWFIFIVGFLTLFYWVYNKSFKGTSAYLIYAFGNNSGEKIPVRETKDGLTIKGVDKRGKTLVERTKVGQPMEIRLGGQKRERWYRTCEYNGQTLGWTEKANPGEGGGSLAHKYRGMSESWIEDLEKASAPKLTTILLPMISGVSFGMVLMWMIQQFLL
jgi:hypothetical protein